LEFMRIHRVFTNFKHWGLGTFHGFRPKHIDAYLNEYVFRWNRRRSFQSGMDRMLGIGLSLKPITDLRGRPGSAPRTRAARQQDLSWRRGALKMSPCRKAIGIHHASRPRNSGSDTCATSRQKRESGPERDLYVSPLFSLTIPLPRPRQRHTALLRDRQTSPGSNPRFHRFGLLLGLRGGIQPCRG